eukprot:CAMPEP_0180343088 /NCGR_PEP_ID=MMETSP0989-20121125/2091_1 /TAXON_ID=697907 /ORGANISM="non described non described, Strain CCMP2293" /LENGTH=113 /DNA_ID=CAMNT_0022332005 /DNA_START=74 /DNA_END=415 /DNA_ORIENTATION=+
MNTRDRPPEPRSGPRRQGDDTVLERSRAARLVSAERPPSQEEGGLPSAHVSSAASLRRRRGQKVGGQEGAAPRDAPREHSPPPSSRPAGAPRSWLALAWQALCRVVSTKNKDE